MSQLLIRKASNDKNRRYREIKFRSDPIELSTARNELTGTVSITINSRPENGDYQYRLDITKDQINSLRWLFEEESK